VTYYDVGFQEVLLETDTIDKHCGDTLHFISLCKDLNMNKKRQLQASIAHISQGTFVMAFMMLNFCVDMKLSSISLMAMLTSFWLTDSRRWSLA